MTFRAGTRSNFFSTNGKLDFGNAFDQGHLFGAGISIPVKPWGLPGKQGLSVIWGDRDATSLSSIGDLNAPVGVNPLDSVDTERFFLTYSFHQKVTSFGDDSKGIGIWGRAGVGDNELSAVAWSLAGGIGGDSPIPGREDDRWGIGLFRFSYADFLSDPLVSPIALGDESGVEVFYRAKLNSWLSLGANIQVIDPPLPGAETVVLFGLRTSIRF